MELTLSILIGTMTASAVYLLLRGHPFPVVLGLSLLGYAVNIFLFASGGLTRNSAPLVEHGLKNLPDLFLYNIHDLNKIGVQMPET